MRAYREYQQKGENMNYEERFLSIWNNTGDLKIPEQEEYTICIFALRFQGWVDDLLEVLKNPEIARINQTKILLELAAKNNLVCLCPNPDITTRHGETLVYTAGFYAQQYQEMGQRVVFFGKPYESIYKYAFKRLGFVKDHSNITQVKEKRRIVVIGDNMANDILGGHNIGVDSILIGTKDDISEFQKQSDSDLTPTYCLYNLR